MKDDELISTWLGFVRRQKEIEDALERKLLDTVGVTLNEYYVLYFLDKADRKSMRLNDLEKQMRLSQSAVSRMILRLENKNCGVIARHTCPEDRRGVYIGLTGKGEEKIAAGKKIFGRILEEYFTGE